jgi:hypothetical protein
MKYYIYLNTVLYIFIILYILNIVLCLRNTIIEVYKCNMPIYENIIYGISIPVFIFISLIAGPLLCYHKKWQGLVIMCLLIVHIIILIPAMQ